VRRCPPSNAYPARTTRASRSSSTPAVFLHCPPPASADGKHVVFGRVLDMESLLVVRKLEHVPTGANGKPTLPCTVAECGEL
jgi:cyclophilin family peptidyl-prolyl cis-trans isomerase